MRDIFISSDDAASLIKDGDTVGLVGGGGGLVEASTLHEAVENRFLSTGYPRNITCLHSLGIGDRKERGMNRFAHEGLVSRVIGGHWVWSPRMQQMAKNNLIEAYVLPSGVLMQLLRETAARRPGLITHVGLGTFVDPRQDGGRMNESAKDTLVDLIHIDGSEYLRYRPIPINIALLKGSFADTSGNISLDEEPANIDLYAMAAATKNSGGKVIFQVRKRVALGDLSAKSVRIPAPLVDAVVIDPNQKQSYQLTYNPSISGEKIDKTYRPPKPTFSVRLLVARRARQELHTGAVINFGFGIPDQVAKLLALEKDSHKYFQTIEHGTYGGFLLDGDLFGYAQNPSCMIDGPSQFDFYSGGGLDIAFLGFGQVDSFGNVNASMLGGNTVGPGGFIDIAQNARKMVFCGTFDTGGAKYSIKNGKIIIKEHGKVQKFVNNVDQITFSGKEALRRNQQVIYVTERAVFNLSKDGLELTEIAPGIDLQKDIIDNLGCSVKVLEELKTMDESIFYNE